MPEEKINSYTYIIYIPYRKEKKLINLAVVGERDVASPIAFVIII